MLRVLFTESATRQVDEIGAWGKTRFGGTVRDGYDLLLAQAVIDLAEDSLLAARLPVPTCPLRGVTPRT